MHPIEKVTRGEFLWCVIVIAVRANVIMYSVGEKLGSFSSFSRSRSCSLSKTLTSQTHTYIHRFRDTVQQKCETDSPPLLLLAPHFATWAATAATTTIAATETVTTTSASAGAAVEN